MKHQFCCLLLLLVNLAAFAGSTKPSGFYEGYISYKSKQWKTTIEFYNDGDNVKAIVEYNDYGVYGLEYVAELSDTNIRLIPSDKDFGTFEGALHDGVFRGRYDNPYLNVEECKFESRLATLPEYHSYRSEKLTFSNGDIKLAGQVIVPKSKGPFKAIVWTHGSGNDQLFYKSRAYFFARHGIASLIYDKRGSGGSTPLATKYHAVNDLAQDAIAGMKALESRQDIIRNKIGVGGFSQGGYISPVVATRNPNTAFIVTGAAPAVTIAEQNLYAFRNQMKGYPSSTADSAVGLLKDYYRCLREGKRSGLQPHVEEMLNASTTKSWFKKYGFYFWIMPLPPDKSDMTELDKDPLENWKITTPVLAANAPH